MKKIVYTSLLLPLLFLPILMYGQYWKTNGNAATTANFLGTTNATNLSIRTDSLVRMTITSAGNVGIGNAAPAYKLDVTGTGHYTSTLKVGAYTLPATDGKNGQVLKTNGTGTLAWKNDSIGASQWVTSGSNIYNTSATYIGIGTSTPGQKLDVWGNGYLAIGEFINLTPNNNFYGVYSTCNVSPGYGTGVYGLGGKYGLFGDAVGDTIDALGQGGYGVWGQSVTKAGGTGVFGLGGTVGVDGETEARPGCPSCSSTGVYGRAQFSPINTGVNGEADNANLINYGVLGIANGSGTSSNYGVYGGGSGGTAYGVYGVTSSGTVRYAGYFNGNVTVTGTFSNPSDRKLKQDIKPLSGALDMINRLTPSTYTYRTNEFKQMNLPEGIHYGLIADEVQQVVPNAVKKETHPATYKNNDYRKGEKIIDAVEFNSVNYIEMIPILIGAVKEQQSIIKSLQDEVDLLKQTMNGSSTNNGTVTIASADEPNTALLGQNIPNPAGKNTIIPFRVPKNCNGASIVISEMGTGKIITAIPVSCNQTNIALDAGTLASGTYSYSLYVDGKVVDTKQMILMK